MAREDRLQLRFGAHLHLHVGDGLGLAADQGLHHLLTLPVHFLQDKAQSLGQLMMYHPKWRLSILLIDFPDFQGD